MNNPFVGTWHGRTWHRNSEVITISGSGNAVSVNYASGLPTDRAMVLSLNPPRLAVHGNPRTCGEMRGNEIVWSNYAVWSRGGLPKPPPPPPDRAPTARISVDAQASEDSVISLRGGDSSDPEGKALTYRWTLTSPSGVVSEPPATATSSFSPSEVGIYEITLVVSDGHSSSPAAHAAVHVVRKNHAPIAKLGDDGSGEVGARVDLDGSSSSDPDGDALTYLWTLTCPAGSQTKLEDTEGPTPHFTPDVPGQYVVSMHVSDGEASSAVVNSLYTVRALNEPPVAEISGTRELTVGEVEQLDASASHDAEGATLTYEWILDRPAGSQAALSDPSSPTPTLIPDIAGEYLVHLRVSDGEKTSKAASFRVTAKPGVANIEIANINFHGEVKRKQTDEFVEIVNSGSANGDLSGWRLLSAGMSLGKEQGFTFPPDTILAPGDRVRVYTNEVHPATGGFTFGSKVAIWRDGGDVATLYDRNKKDIVRFTYGDRS